MERARFLLSEALDSDEKGDVEDAMDLYAQAVELCIKVVSWICCYSLNTSFFYFHVWFAILNFLFILVLIAFCCMRIIICGVIKSLQFQCVYCLPS